ncbi:MAG: SIR2 family protein [Pseudomonadota bacterium]|nr:SIR2 family protein [Pseudomonadota bacterium]
MLELQIASETRLATRLFAAIQRGEPTTFLFGAGLSAPSASSGGRGVPGVNGIVALIRAEVAQVEDPTEFDAVVRASSNRYQAAMQYMLDCLGQPALNLLIRKAVLSAYSLPFEAADLADNRCERFEHQLAEWALPSGIEALGKIITSFPRVFNQPLLTSNFDPLAEVAIRRAGGRATSLFLPSDGRLDSVSSSDSHAVVHLHGSWARGDTLHTPIQLRRSRPSLKGSLRELLRQSTLVVMGYGGWDDVFTRTLVEIVAEGGESHNILWCFFEAEEADIRSKYPALLESIAPGIGHRVVLYSGIDSNALLPRLVQRLVPDTSSAVPSIAPALAEVAPPPVATAPATPLGGYSCDAPPTLTQFVGRAAELRRLATANSPIVLITGIGGQGKSALAARHVQNLADSREIDFWDWRDCREEADTLQAQLLSIVERLSGGRVPIGELGTQGMEAIVDVLFRELGSSRGLFVFDNIDQYIDLVTLAPARGMELFFGAIARRPHRSRFVFTCRPELEASFFDCEHMRLPGLSLEHARELFASKGFEATKHARIIADAHRITDGHALWLALIARQAGSRNIESLMRNVERDRTGDLPTQTLRSIWDSLNDSHRMILRTVAELVLPDTKEKIRKYLPKAVDWYQYTQHFKSLCAMDLVAARRNHAGAMLYELHPVIRRFVHDLYPTEKRKRFIDPLVAHFSEVVSSIKAAIIEQSAEPSIADLSNFSCLIELHLNEGAHGTALVTLNDSQVVLMDGGLHEDYLRLSKRLLREMDWREAIAKNDSVFASAFSATITKLSELGAHREVDEYLEHFDTCIAARSPIYIAYCSLRCYALWCRRDFRGAVEWGRRGYELKRSTGVDTRYDSSHNLALALRDGGDPTAALELFLNGIELRQVIANKVRDEHRGEFYGNVGRCLWFMSRPQDALVCYRKSLATLEWERSTMRLLNRGYGHLWIGEALEAVGDAELAYCFFREALQIWEPVAPPLAQMVLERVRALEESGILAQPVLDTLDSIEVSRRCALWLRQ